MLKNLLPFLSILKAKLEGVVSVQEQDGEIRHAFYSCALLLYQLIAAAWQQTLTKG